MQTFLPFPDFERSARVLDYRRLGKQRVEAFQIIRTLRGISKGWATHPAVLMWQGHDACLGLYMDAMIREWIARGYRNTMALSGSDPDAPPPPWLGDEAIHASHRAALLSKDPDHYGGFGWAEAPAYAYVWPSDPRVAA